MPKSTRFDTDRLARETLAQLNVQPGQVIQIWANKVSMDLVEALAFHIRKSGAFWSLRLTSEPLLKRIGKELPREYLGLVPEHELGWLEDVDAIIELRDHGRNIPDVPIDRRKAMGAEWLALIDAAAAKGIRRVMVVNPTAALAKACGLALADLRERVSRAMEVDYAAVDARQDQIASLLNQATEVHVLSPAGANIRMKVNGRKARVDTDSLPYGETYIAPLEDSANGVALIDQAFFRGRKVEKFLLSFKNGRVVDELAPDYAGVASFCELMQASTGDKDRIAEFAIGLNPGLTEPIGYSSLDEKIGGSVHLAIGANTRFGGVNQSNLHLDLVILKPTVWFDDILVLEEGEFQI
jgi:aminopeptidase